MSHGVVDPFMMKNILGVVLAGGRSSRMGTNKALLSYRGVALVEHMNTTLKQTGLETVVVAGEVAGYPSIADASPFSGPASAIMNVMAHYADFTDFLVVPVDMPLLTTGLVERLLQQPKGAYFSGWPLPCYIPRPEEGWRSDAESVKQLLLDCSVPSITLPSEMISMMKNVNTPDEWRALLEGDG